MTNIERLAMRLNRLEGGAPSIKELEAVIALVAADLQQPRGAMANTDNRKPLNTLENGGDNA